jgi:hypothetical protein
LCPILALSESINTPNGLSCSWGPRDGHGLVLEEN